MAVLYTATSLAGFTSFNEDFDYTLATMLAANPLLINDNSFRSNKEKLSLYIDAGNQALERSSDIESAQLCYDQGTELRLSSPYFFNESTS